MRSFNNGSNAFINGHRIILLVVIAVFVILSSVIVVVKASSSSTTSTAVKAAMLRGSTICGSSITSKQNQHQFLIQRILQTEVDNKVVSLLRPPSSPPTIKTSSF
jgi:hypothetical protein